MRGGRRLGGEHEAGHAERAGMDQLQRNIQVVPDLIRSGSREMIYVEFGLPRQDALARICSPVPKVAAS